MVAGLELYIKSLPTGKIIGSNRSSCYCLIGNPYSSIEIRNLLVQAFLQPLPAGWLCMNFSYIGHIKASI